MRLVLGFTALFCGLMASQQQETCKTPTYIKGKFIVNDDEKMWNYEYNAVQNRLRVFEMEHHTNGSFTYDYLLHFGVGVMYEIDGETFACTKKPLRTEYQPIGIPTDARFVNSTVYSTPQDDLNPPRFCPDTSVISAGRPVDLISLFSKSKARRLTRALSKLKNVYRNNYTVL